MPVKKDEQGRNISEKFDIGRNFCNKIWNASRFALTNLHDMPAAGFDPGRMEFEDHWILSRLAQTAQEMTRQLDDFKFSEPVSGLYRFFWNELCDWYLEIIKPRMRDDQKRGSAQQVLAFVLDAALRLFHPFMPFISEGIYQTLRQTCPNRDLEGVGRLGDSEHLISAAWPVLPEALVNRAAEEQMSLVQNTIRAIRDIRTRYKIAPRQPLAVSVKTHPQQANLLLSREAMIRNLANLERFAAGPDCEKPANAAVAVGADMEIYVHDVIDEQAERERLLKQKEEVSRNIQSVAGKLKNENFITRANPEVVQRERDRLQQLQEQLDMIQSNLNVLADGRSTRGQSAI